MTEASKARILYCVLNWGLGHATRSIPVIKELLKRGVEIEIASDGGPLKLLQKTFPDVTFHELPAYDINYPSRSVLINAISQARKMFRAVWKERRFIDTLVRERGYDAIISDNRYGCHHKSIPNVLITHQLSNLAESWLLSLPGEMIVRSYLKYYEEVWIPDTPDRKLSGKMTETNSSKARFLGYISDQLPEKRDHMYDIAAILSGPEPQRTKLEEEVLPQLARYPGKTVLVRGVIKEEAAVHEGNLTIYPYKDRAGVNELLNTTAQVLCRTGYSSLMDLLSTGTKAILVPTPGQPEQIYLGEQLKEHPLFVVQKQGEVDVMAGVKELANKNGVQEQQKANVLLGEIVGAFLKKIAK
jgi:uncharacterized protein (TIGR00661 family)